MLKIDAEYIEAAHKSFIFDENEKMQKRVKNVREFLVNETVIPNIGKYKGQVMKIRDVSWSSLSGFGFHLETNDDSRHRDTLYHVEDFKFTI